MRQAGILAAAGIVALQKMTDRLGQDHRRARKLAEGVKANPSIRVEPDTPATNMVYFDLGPEVRKTTAQIEHEMEAEGILVHSSGPRQFRLVTHYWIDDGAVEQTVGAIIELVN